MGSKKQSIATLKSEIERMEDTIHTLLNMSRDKYYHLIHKDISYFLKISTYNKESIRCLILSCSTKPQERLQAWSKKDTSFYLKVSFKPQDDSYQFHVNPHLKELKEISRIDLPLYIMSYTDPNIKAHLNI